MMSIKRIAFCMISCASLTIGSAAYSQNINAQLQANITRTLQEADNLINQLGPLHDRLDALRVELEKADPLAGDIISAANSLNSSSTNVEQIAQAVFVFNFADANNVFTVDPDQLEACVSRQAYAGGIQSAASAMRQIVEAFDQKVNLLNEAVSKINQQTNSVANTDVLIQELADEGFLSDSEVENVQDILDEAASAYGETEQISTTILQRINQQKPIVTERLQTAEALYQEFQANPLDCYYMIVGSWLKQLQSGRSLRMCVTAQNKFEIAGYTYGIKVDGSKAKTRDWNGRTEGDGTSIFYPSTNKTYTHRIFSPGTASAQICDDPNHTSCFVLSSGGC